MPQHWPGLLQYSCAGIQVVSTKKRLLTFHTFFHKLNMILGLFKQWNICQQDSQHSGSSLTILHKIVLSHITWKQHQLRQNPFSFPVIMWHVCLHAAVFIVVYIKQGNFGPTNDKMLDHLKEGIHKVLGDPDSKHGVWVRVCLLRSFTIHLSFNLISCA